MPFEKKKYLSGPITVIWQPKLCIHSGICFKGLPSVFDPRRKPWIVLENAMDLSIIEQVKNCPSGALSFVYNEENKTD